ncbi:MAG: zf-TFIIB domain-containing protein, partial [Deltaproteobacteria bacterium]|nr:zf-TFIIB domain-containing protein [Deltaproteobacteria bacterium]
NCNGVWFDAGELGLFLETMKLEDPNLYPAYFLTSPEAKTSEKKRKCPICGKKMRKTTVGEERKILIDACPKGDGLWFDHGEVERLVTQLGGKSMEKADSQGRIINFLGKTFIAIK